MTPIQYGLLAIIALDLVLIIISGLAGLIVNQHRANVEKAAQKVK